MTTHKEALEAAYLAGFNASGEGYNGEYPFGDKMQDPAENRVWKKDRDNYIKEALAQPEQDCTRSHPHEEMSKECELRTEIARLTNELARLKAKPKEPEHEPVAFPDAPQTIYLQVGDECPEDAKWKELVDVCWCDEQVFDNDIVYVRADTTPPQRKPSKEHALYETFAKIAAYLEIDTEAAQSAAGKPSDVFIEAIKKREAPQRKPLTDEQIGDIAALFYPRWQGHDGFARAIEAAHGIKGDA